MSNDCEYPNLLLLDHQSVKNIEYLCKKQKHMGNENIIEVIQQDLAVLNSLGLTRKDIYANHLNMVLKLTKTNYYKAFSTFETDNKQINELIDSTPDELICDWSCSETLYNQIDINDQTLIIYCFVWTKSETCPIETFFNKRATFDNVGNKDYFIVNVKNKKSIWVPDLVMRQVGLFGFFQGEKSKYRVDPLKYIEVMGINKRINLLETIKDTKWLNKGIITGRIKSVTKRLQTDSYKAYMYDGNKLCIKFLNDNWLNNNDGDFIDMFGIPLFINASNELNTWYKYESTEDIFLTEGDCTIEINDIKIKEKSIHKERGKVILNELLDAMDPLNYLLD